VRDKHAGYNNLPYQTVIVRVSLFLNAVVQYMLIQHSDWRIF